MNNEKHVSLPLQLWCVDSTYSGSREDKHISCTELLNPVQCFILSRRAEKTAQQDTDVLDYWKAQIGTAIHSGVASAWVDRYQVNLAKLGYSEDYISRIKINPEEVLPKDIPVYVEQRVSKEILGWTVHGQYDMVFDGQLIDFKSTSTFTYENKTKDKDYIMQGSIYRWLAPEKITSENIAINFIFTDWKDQKAAAPSYPSAPLLEYRLPLLSLSQIQTFVLDKITRINTALESGVVPECTHDEMKWTPSTYAYYSGTSTTGRATKVFDTYHEALRHKVDKGKGTVQERLGKPIQCKYCKGKSLCNQYKKLGLE